jgi:voltage-gated potassium channel
MAIPGRYKRYIWLFLAFLILLLVSSTALLHYDYEEQYRQDVGKFHFHTESGNRMGQEHAILYDEEKNETLYEDGKWTSYNFGVAFYWSLVTVSTVGYGDVFPVSEAGLVIGSVLILMGLGFFGIIIGTISSILVESKLKGVLGMHKNKFEGHDVICGWTPVSKVVLPELITADRKVIVITEDPDDIPDIQRAGTKENVFVIHGDPSSEKVLEEARVKFAKTVIISTDEDERNLIISLHIKEVNPNARIVVKINREELRKTLQIAGVTYVSSPYVTSGRLIASAAFEPEVAWMVDDVTTGTTGYDLAQYTLKDKEELVNKKFEHVSRIIRRETTAMLLGVARYQEGTMYKLHLNPPEDLIVKNHDILLVLCSMDDHPKLESFLGVKEGR